jgi:hypothetical protein
MSVASMNVPMMTPDAVLQSRIDARICCKQSYGLI